MGPLHQDWKREEVLCVIEELLQMYFKYMHFALIAKRFYMQEDHSIVYYNAFVSTFISSDIRE